MLEYSPAAYMGLSPLKSRCAHGLRTSDLGGQPHRGRLGRYAGGDNAGDENAMLIAE
jgi:hypothetical protein